ncbi:MAG: nitroreductase family protein [Candidatus Altiarchaeales archaeon]|nr:nitroreductase family protein [Candidatus Altiarchaeales archaeon]
MDVLNAIKSRRSVREFTDEDVSDKQIESILEAGRWAPSGLNNQPWKFKVIRDLELKKKLAECTHYGKTLMNAPVSIAVFLDNSGVYDRTKDLQAMGACIQNMLLATHASGLGAVWLGEILKKRKQAEKILTVPEDCELMAVIAVGKPKNVKSSSSRKSMEELML